MGVVTGTGKLYSVVSCEANANIANSPREILRSELRDFELRGCSVWCSFNCNSVPARHPLETNIALSSVPIQELSVAVISHPQWRRATSSGLPCPSAHLHRQ